MPTDCRACEGHGTQLVRNRKSIQHVSSPDHLWDEKPCEACRGTGEEPCQHLIGFRKIEPYRLPSGKWVHTGICRDCERPFFLTRDGDAAVRVEDVHVSAYRREASDEGSGDVFHGQTLTARSA